MFIAILPGYLSAAGMQGEVSGIVRDAETKEPLPVLMWVLKV